MNFLSATLRTSMVSLLLLAATAVQAETTYAALDRNQWTYDTDPYGSEAIINEKLIRHGGIWIKFKRVPRIDEKRNSWIELIHKLPSASLTGIKKIRLTYQCDTPLLIKLSQQEYGKNGDQSYAHYQIKLPPARQWTTQEVDLKDFYRPEWTPASSTDIGLLPEHIDAIYLTPSLTDKDGGEAILQVRAIELLP
ncbi:hypothetical protein CMT41_17415 [Colwellia sp. MT41]|uniref:CBM11 domain-containing protein n=1 Tax=Colwellia marinimaniae TaxID=1513592 RepID=A0ABQ0MW08_9GAMM|nr:MULTISPECIES: hypothetical protein [Colwellia]ALO36314.1 hypothetical protein CMT41_17415 [Colwellia sp. MT41]GAW96563.1 hypothetical protein MTCD1_02182 [Colwellia marinimaniae]